MQAQKCFLKSSFDDCIYIFHYPELLLLHCPEFRHVQFSKPDFFCSHLFARQLLQTQIETKHFRITLEGGKNSTYLQVKINYLNYESLVLKLRYWIPMIHLNLLPTSNSFQTRSDSNQALHAIINWWPENTTRKCGAQFTCAVSLTKHAKFPKSYIIHKSYAI